MHSELGHVSKAFWIFGAVYTTWPFCHLVNSILPNTLWYFNEFSFTGKMVDVMKSMHLVWRKLFNCNACTECKDVDYLLQMKHGLCVCVSVEHSCKPHKNGENDRGAIWVWTWLILRNHVLRGGLHTPRGRGNFGCTPFNAAFRQNSLTMLIYFYTLKYFFTA